MGATETEEGALARFALDDSTATRAIWPHRFHLELEAIVGGAQLDVRLRVVNTGHAAFEFTGALHTYFRVSDAAAILLGGLRGTRFLNRGESETHVEPRESVTAIEPIDRIYFATPSETRLEDAGRSLRISQRGFTDTVVWNPGREVTAGMADMPPEGYTRMLCVEAAAIEPPVPLSPGVEWSGAQTILETRT
jgi:glucose-6-phosphate 1-epimerase